MLDMTKTVAFFVVKLEKYTYEFRNNQWCCHQFCQFHTMSKFHGHLRKCNLPAYQQTLMSAKKTQQKR